MDARAVIRGTTEENGRVEVRRGSTTIGTETADANGDYAIEIPAPDKAGDDELTVALVEDNTDKKTITVTAAYGAGVAITDPSDEANLSGQYEIRGTAQSGASVSVRINNGTEHPVQVNANGQWSADVILPMGETTITATQKSKGSNTTTSAVTVNPGESNTRPFEITSPENNGTVSGPNVKFEGKAEPGTTVRVIKGQTVVMTKVTTNANGAWVGTSGNLSNGVHDLTVEYTEPGQSQPQTRSLRITVENGVVQPFNWATPGNGNTVLGTFSVTGTATTGTQVNLIRKTGGASQTVMDTITTGANGEWKGTGTLATGTYKVTLQYKEPGKDKVSLDRTITVNDGMVQPFNWATPGEGDILDSKFSITGTATAGTMVNVIRPTSGNPIPVMDNVYADAQGNWSGLGTLAVGTHNIVVQYKEPGKGKVSFGRTVTVEERTVTPFEITNPSDGDTVDTAFVFTGKATTGTRVNVQRLNGSNNPLIMEEVVANGKGEWTGGAALAVGTHNLRAQFREPGSKDKDWVDFTLTVR